MPKHGPWLVMPVAFIRPFLWLILGLVWSNATLAVEEPYRVLVLHSFRNSLPINSDWDKGLVRGFTTGSDIEVWLDTEALDLARTRDADYLDDLRRVIRLKYDDTKPQLIIPTDTPALKFLLDYGEELFPDVPVVFLGAQSQYIATWKLPPYITGITGFLDIAGTLELALRVHPATRQVAVIVGSGPNDQGMEQQALQVLKPFEGSVKFLWLKGMPLDELTEAVRRLPRDSVILYLVELQDRNGKRYVPVNVLNVLSPAANAPIYGLWDTLLGHGVTGGRMVRIENDGYLAALMALRILEGEAPAAVPVVDRKQNAALFDGRQLARWGLDADRLPDDSQVLNREESIWEEHRKEIMVASAIIVVQGVLIVALILSRRRLRQAQTALHQENDRRGEAERIAGRLRERIARFSKQRSLGTMATTIAHEINQPLIAIQNYAQAAKRRLQSDVEDKPKLIELFAKIEGQAERAGAITQDVRMLVSSGEPVLHTVHLGPLFQEVIRMLEPEVNNRGCGLVFEHGDDLPAVLADTLQVQLVLVNLLQNAMQSVCAGDQYNKQVIVDTRRNNQREVQVSVIDRGPGVPGERLADIFEPLYSETKSGMGMGLAVSRTIIKAHGGRLWYEPNPDGGAIFRFTLQMTG